MYFLITNDVEIHSIPKNIQDPAIADEVHSTGIPRLLNLYAKYDIRSTFYFTGNYVEVKPESLDLVKDHGHEIGCHGYTHNIHQAFDIMSYDEQVEHLTRAKKLIEDVVGSITAFKAPALRINEHTIKALETTGFKIDSSVAPQRFDGPFSFGSHQKLKWLFAPRMPYHPAYDSPFRKGNSSVLEVPISAAIAPYIGTLMRINPSLFRVLEKYLFYEAKKTKKPVVFIFHPTECLNDIPALNTEGEITRRSTSYLEYMFADKIRVNLKLKNLGLPSLKLLEEVIRRGTRYGFEYISVSDFAAFYVQEVP